MTDVAQQPTEQVQDAQSFISAGFDRRDNNDRDSEVLREAYSSTGSPPAGSPSATDPAAQANAPAVPNGQVAPQGQGQAAPLADGTAKPPAMVPVAALTGERERRQQAEQFAWQMQREFDELKGYVQATIQSQPQVQQAQQQPQDPHPMPSQYRNVAEFMIADPDGHAKWIEDRATWRAEQKASAQSATLQQQVMRAAWQADEVRASQTYGAEFVASVKEHVRRNPNLSREFSRHPDPYSRAAEWARQDNLRRAIPNGDLQAYDLSVANRLLSDPNFIGEMQKRFAPGVAALPAGVPPALGSVAPTTGHPGLIQSPEDFFASRFASRRAG